MSVKIRVGIWGLGRAGNSMHVRELLLFPEQFEIVAGCDTSEDRRQAMAKQCSCRLYAEARALLADPEVDLVSVATRSPDHATHACQALKAGKYVFLEKPIALNMADAQQLIEADRQFPGKLFLRHNRRFEPPFVRIREIMASGVLGDVYEIKLHRHGYQRRADWQTLIECGGGQLNNWGPHIIEHALRFLEAPVVDVWADLKRVAALGDAEDHLKIVLRNQVGRIVDLEISGGVALSQPDYVIFGTRGALTCEGNTIHLKHIDPAQVFPPSGAESGNPPLAGGFGEENPVRWINEDVTVESKPEEGLASIWGHLYKAIRQDVPFPITLEQGVEVVRITEQARRVSAFGKGR